MFFIDMYGQDAAFPKRGDLVQSNVGDKRERTWMILRSHRSRREPKGVPRFYVWMARWWEIEPDLRMRLYRSAQRNGGQNVIEVFRYPRATSRSRPAPIPPLKRRRG